MENDGRDDGEAVAAEEAEAPPQDDEESNNEEEDLLFINCQTLMDKITAAPLNPNPNVLHALATILETHETRSFSIYFILFDCFQYSILRILFIYRDY